MNIKNTLFFAIKKGLVNIFMANGLEKFFLFITSIFLVRILSKKVYGAWSYALNIYYLFMLLKGLGATSAILQFCSAEKDPFKKLAFFRYGLLVGTGFNLGLSLLILLFTFFFDLPFPESMHYLSLLCFLPVFVILFESGLVYYRATFRNRYFSWSKIIYSLLYCLFCVGGAYYFQISGLVSGRYLALAMAIIFSIILLKNEIVRLPHVPQLKRRERKEFFVYAVFCMLSNTMASLLYLVDLFLIGLILKNESLVAVYKTATLIPFALNIIPQSVMIFAYSYFARMHGDGAKVKKYYLPIQRALLLVNAVIVGTALLAAPFIIRTLFSARYQAAVLPFRILMIGYFVGGTFRIPAGNVLASLKKVNLSLAITVASAVVNIILDIVLISNYQMIGAAWATVAVFCFSSLLAHLYLRWYFKSNSGLNR